MDDANTFITSNLLNLLKIAKAEKIPQAKNMYRCTMQRLHICIPFNCAIKDQENKKKEYKDIAKGIILIFLSFIIHPLFQNKFSTKTIYRVFGQTLVTIFFKD